jgi:general secretion pathway protein K
MSQHLSRLRGRQRGVAVVTALLLTTLAVSIVASLFWQQQVQVRSMENQRLHVQSRWILRGGLDLVRLVLRQDASDSHGITRADGIWATPLAETRLDQFVERERVQNESFDATLSGQTFDAQSRYNLASLANSNGLLPAQVGVLQRLLQNLQLNPALAKPLAELVARSLHGGAATTAPPPGGQPQATDPVPVPDNGSQPMPLLRVEDLLAVAGFSPQAVEKLREYVVVLPADVNKVNVNTASAEVLAALTDMSLSEAQTMVSMRKRTAFGSPDNFNAVLKNFGAKKLAPGVEVDVFSNYFLVLSKVHLDRAELVTWSLLRREPNRVSIVWIRET